MLRVLSFFPLWFTWTSCYNAPWKVWWINTCQRILRFCLKGLAATGLSKCFRSVTGINSSDSIIMGPLSSHLCMHTTYTVTTMLGLMLIDYKYSWCIDASLHNHNNHHHHFHGHSMLPHLDCYQNLTNGQESHQETSETTGRFSTGKPYWWKWQCCSDCPCSNYYLHQHEWAERVIAVIRVKNHCLQQSSCIVKLPNSLPALHYFR